MVVCGLGVVSGKEVDVVGWVTIIVWAKNVSLGSHMPTKIL